MSNTLQTLSQLNSGQLKGATKLKISAELTEFPEAIFSLADTLEVLELSNNKLSSLPDNFDRLTRLKILFLSNNPFTELPSVLAKCKNLTMIGFKSCQITTVPENALPLKTRWLILTDNKITALPNSIGQLTQLEKLALAGNQLAALPASMKNCHQLALIRLAANNFTQLPEWLFTLPKLAWLAFSGNPFDSKKQVVQLTNTKEALAEVSLEQYTVKQVLGKGASGVIHQAYPLSNTGEETDKPVAIKLFKGFVTSDGYPEDELNHCIQAGQHDNLISTLAKVSKGEQLALVMSLIPAHYINLGLPPSLQSCSRDTFEQDLTLSLSVTRHLITQLADVLSHLHQQHISHGDIYAHNILCEPSTTPNCEASHLLFGDFGASSNLALLPLTQQHAMQKIELKAFGYFIDDLLSITTTDRLTSREQQQLGSLKTIKAHCLADQVSSRPFSSEINKLCRAI